MHAKYGSNAGLVSRFYTRNSHAHLIMPLPKRMSRLVFSSAIKRATWAFDKPVSGSLYFPAWHSIMLKILQSLQDSIHFQRSVGLLHAYEHDPNSEAHTCSASHSMALFAHLHALYEGSGECHRSRCQRRDPAACSLTTL